MCNDRPQALPAEERPGDATGPSHSTWKTNVALQMQWGHGRASRCLNPWAAPPHGRDNSSCQASGGSTLMSFDDGMHKEQLIARFEGLTDRQNGPLLTPLLLCKDDSTMLQVSI